jgi:hypothetical protein
MKIVKKFYVAADRVTSYGADWCHPTLEGAIKHAEKLLEQEPGTKAKYIVKIIKVVKRRNMPVIVEDVK